MQFDRTNSSGRSNYLCNRIIGKNKRMTNCGIARSRVCLAGASRSTNNFVNESELLGPIETRFLRQMFVRARNRSCIACIWHQAACHVRSPPFVRVHFRSPMRPPRAHALAYLSLYEVRHMDRHSLARAHTHAHAHTPDISPFTHVTRSKTLFFALDPPTPSARVSCNGKEELPPQAFSSSSKFRMTTRYKQTSITTHSK